VQIAEVACQAWRRTIVVASEVPHGAIGTRFPLLTEAEVRTILKVSGTTIDRMIADGALPVVRIRRTRRFRREDVLGCVERNRSDREA